MIKVLLVLTAIFAVSCNQQKPDVKSDKGKFSYAVGYEIGKNMKRQGVELHYGSFVKALQDVMGDKKVLLDENQRREAMKKMAEAKQKKDSEKAANNKKKATDFLAANKGKEGVKTTASGLQYQILKEGNGAKPKETDKVKVHYKGTLLDGTTFDSSYERKQPAEFPLNAVIKGWTEGLQLMKVGGKAKFWISPELGYGDRANSKIPGNSLLTFEVELLEIVKEEPKKK